MGKTDITGKRFNRLVAISFVSGTRSKILWKFKCDCGNVTIKNRAYVSCGDTKSCGCMNREPHRFSHKMSDTRFYKIYSGIKTRCENPNAGCFKRYGGRGIKCLWNSFDEFKADMYESYLQHIKEFGERKTSIERIDSNGNYCGNNCRWATFTEQCNNRRTNRFVTYNGESHTLAEWAKLLDLDYKQLHSRFHTLGWTFQRAIASR